MHWYNRDLKDSESERKEEIRKIKEAEADALAVCPDEDSKRKYSPGKSGTNFPAWFTDISAGIPSY